MAVPRQASGGELGIGGDKLGSAVGVQGHDVGGVAVQPDWEWQSNRRHTIVAVAADVSCSPYDRVRPRSYGVLTRSRRWCRGWRCCWSWRCCWGRRRRWDLARGLDQGENWRACLKEAHRRIGKVRFLVGIEPEVIQCAKANRIGVLVLRKCLSIPRYRVTSLSNSPGRAAIALVVQRAIVCKAGLLWRRVKSNIAYVNSGSDGHPKRLNGAIQVLVIDGILVVKNASRRVRYSETHKENAIISRIRADLVYARARRACPSHNGRLSSHRAAKRCKREACGAAHAILTIGGVVEHVALAGVRLAKGEFARSDVLRFGKIGRAGVLRCVQITGLNANPVRYAIMHVPSMVVRGGLPVSISPARKIPRKRIDPCPRADPVLVAI